MMDVRLLVVVVVLEGLTEDAAMLRIKSQSHLQSLQLAVQHFGRSRLDSRLSSNIVMHSTALSCAVLNFS